MLTLLVSVVTSQALAPQGLKVYRGKDGQRVEVVTLALQQPGKGAGPNALVRVTGSGSERDGLVFRGTTSAAQRGTSFTMKYGGKDWELCRNDDGDLEVWMPGLPRSFHAKYDDAATTAGDKGAVVKEHQAQLADDAIALAEKAEWPNLVARYTKKAAEASASLSKACGASVTLTIRFATFDDDTMANLDVWKLCSPMVSALESRCAAVKARPKVVCQLGAAPAVEKLEGVLRITTTTKSVTTSFVQTELGT
ncbi:MAG: hypothetical protein JNM69_33415 [Archangium sp.]|nr:hypothetical protein [Archangium sp.]